MKRGIVLAFLLVFALSACNAVTEGPSDPVEEDSGIGGTPIYTDNPPVNIDPPATDNPSAEDPCTYHELPIDSALKVIVKCPGEPARPIRKGRP